MAKKGMIQRDVKRAKLYARYGKRREELKRIIANPDTPDEEFYEAQQSLAKLPRNSARSRQRNRCSITGRPRAYIRKFGLSRITFRELASKGQIPGVTKSSW